MYYYIVDPQSLNQRQFERVQNQLYSSLSAFRINGEVTRVTSLRTIAQLVESAFARGAKTIVAVGNDETLSEVINEVRGREVIVGFIPVEFCEAGEILGIPDIETGAKIIASRRITELDLGIVSWLTPATGTVGEQTAGAAFFTKLSFGAVLPGVTKISWFDYKTITELFRLPGLEIKFAADRRYTGSLSILAGMVVNCRGGSCRNSKFALPNDNLLEVLLLPKLNRYQLFTHRQHIVNGCFEKIPSAAVLHVKSFEITGPEGLALRVGEKCVAKTPARIRVEPNVLKIIAGRDRLF